MVYLKNFSLLSEINEHNLSTGLKNIYNSYYPLGLFPRKEFQDIIFSNVTIFYGDNGSGKTTLLNIIASKLNANRKMSLAKGEIFDMYVNSTSYDLNNHPIEIKLITSDDIFDNLIDIRSINASVNRYKEDLSREYLNYKYNNDDTDFFDLEEVKKMADSRNKTMSKFIRSRLTNNNIIEKSNGETSLEYWEREIKENSIYILDEPENSLSSENQLKLKKFIEESARFYNCQFIISTHSPFLLNITDALIYDLDSIPVKTRKWSELPNIKVYYNFFKERENEFEN